MSDLVPINVRCQESGTVSSSTPITRSLRPFLRLCLLTLILTLLSLPLLGASVAGGSSDSSLTLNTRGLALAQDSTSPDLVGATKLFQKAVKKERQVLKKTRKELRKQLRKEEDAGVDHEEDDESEKVIEIRSRIRTSKSMMAEYLNNEGVAEMRQSHLNTARRLLKEALHFKPDYKEAERNLDELDELVEKGTKSKDDSDDEDDEEEEQEERSTKKKKKDKKKNKKKKSKTAKKRKSDDDEDDSEAVVKKDESKEEVSVYDRPAKRQPQRDPEAKEDVDKTQQRKKRLSVLDRPRRPNTNKREKLPRIHLAHMNLPENEVYRKGLAPFILLGALDGWKFDEHWSLDTFGTLYPNATVDFYPHNMDQVSVRPFLTPFPKALKEQQHPTHAYPESDTHPGSYIQWNVGWWDWKAMTKNMLPDGLPSFFRDDDDWLMTQQPDCLPTYQLQDEFTKKTHWRMVLIGNRGAGMFNHQDVLRTSSYQAQVAGAKRWHVCAPSESQFLGRAGSVDTFDPDYVKSPLFHQAKCFEDVVETGEMIFYPADYWHQTENIQTPTISVSGSIMNAHNYQFIADELNQECRYNKYKWGFSKELCDALLNHCFAYWKQTLGRESPTPLKDEL